MTEMSLIPRHGRPPGSAGLAARPPLTLAEEHMLLLWQVTESADKLLTATEHGRWPGAELAALAGYAQAEVLRQASDEEAMLFPAVPAQTAAGLARDHVRLRAAAELLSRAAAGEQAMSPAQAATAVRDFVVQLERHLRNEDDLLASGRAPRDVPGTERLGGRSHEWYPLTEGPEVDLDALPAGQAVAAATDRLLRMRRGEQVELQWSTDLNPVWREMNELSPDGYRFTVLQDGPVRWRMRVTRRQAAG
ncbi:MAG TPA: hemerythrin domain-containing protein [Streptosporangiaceae bacterium]|nr:hemerythrin domain-containing protein [Streptosporangiaceae bacterium]